MANIRKITLCWYAKVGKTWRYFPVLFEDHHGVKQARHGFVVEKGKIVEYPNGRYVLRSYEKSKKVYAPIESCNPRDAVLALQKARRAAVGAPSNPRALTVKKAIDAYIKDCMSRNAKEAATQAKVVLNEFLPLCHAAYPNGITREIVLSFHRKLRSRGLTERTIHNKAERLKIFLRWCGVDVKKVVPPSPKFEEKLPEIYSAAEINAILDAAEKSSPVLAIAISMALQLGLREQELTFAEWADIDTQHSAFRVQGKARYGFLVKDSEQRDIPIPAELLSVLSAWRKTRKGSTLILGTASDKPNTHLLRSLKRLAKGAGLNCGRCEGCKGKLGECQEWYLHRFRSTYLTTLLRQGIDARTVQAFAGHSDLATTLKYLKPASATEMQSKINSIVWATN
jgi:integrase